ncbi:66ad245d-c43f-439e-a20c-caea22ff8d36-CDS [Sclerotinia trifoliorum]|uniref:ribonuclease H n=1 Tax=Sclerotinia trifoliorum TaxID=28548 RepID=A0A8H2VM87_9HELO|nr:66ad245d-c43f-439e-a20c-caea22ff8d36-CDS [Sclerotinia trifoliorum]
MSLKNLCPFLLQLKQSLNLPSLRNRVLKRPSKTHTASYFLSKNLRLSQPTIVESHSKSNMNSFNKCVNSDLETLYNRHFIPELNDLYIDRPTDMLCACPDCGALTGLFKDPTGSIKRDDRSQVIFVDGACSGNGQAGAQASYGVYFGDGAKNNRSGLIDRDLPQTNQVAELVAAIVALKIARGQLYEDIEKRVRRLPNRHSILIITDSAYVVNGATSWVLEWNENGFRTSTGAPVKNAELFVELDDLIEEFKGYHVPVWFWHVRREFNRSADAMARIPLYGDQEIPAVIPFIRD